MSHPARVEEEVEALGRLDLEGLRRVWQERYGPSPKLRSVELMRHLLAWRLQATALGGLDRTTRRQLERRGPVKAEGLALGTGARLCREWQGRQIEVIVEDKGFRWNDQTLAELVGGGEGDHRHPLERPSVLRASAVERMSTSRKRCALYTRKSSEDGLEQDFNSLDAQREACCAYVKSQASEGWRAIDAVYDDGGYSGGSMERPALKRLLADIAADKVDVVVVYKIDRLTRSLADFARMVELFDHQEVSFVSVTQAFNTTSSMGRLTLNVLLSFAQFEREVTGERIRDKIAASKAKGLWMGGITPLGYDRPADGSRTLTVNASEAETVCLIFETYLRLRSVHALERWLTERGIRSKRHVTRNGKTRGGQPFSRGALFHMLRNKIYLGLIVHKGTAHQGKHAAIINAALFDQVQALLDSQARRHAAERSPVAKAPLTGRLIDADGQPMSPTFSYGKGGKAYRYYVSAPLQRGRRRSDDRAIRRVPAVALEGLLSRTLRRLVPVASDQPLDLPTRVEIHAQSLQLLLPIHHLPTVRGHLTDGEQVEVDPADATALRLTLPIRFKVRGGKTEVIGGQQPKTRRDPNLIRALRSAHALLTPGIKGLPTLETSPASTYQRRLIRLAFLAPDLQRAILDGRQPPGLTLSRIMEGEVPLSWSEQQKAIGTPIQN